MKKHLVVKGIDTAVYNYTTYFEVSIGKHPKLSIIACVFLRLIIDGQYLLLKK